MRTPSHKWWILLIKFMIRPTIRVRGGLRIYGIPGVSNNFPILYILCVTL